MFCFVLFSTFFFYAMLVWFDLIVFLYFLFKMLFKMFYSAKVRNEIRSFNHIITTDGRRFVLDNQSWDALTC